jgi:VacB/RNase II family 3'-5' exoribonuclease
MVEHDLQPDFPSAALQELSSIAGLASAPAAEVRDLRQLLWSSIDNDDSRDLDQLAVGEPLAGGAVKILVAVADVDSLVKAGSAIDDHARGNTTSVYTAAQIFPMLPERLSTDLTSLNEAAERLAVVVEMTVDADGNVIASDVYRARVFNRAKLAYNSIAAWLDQTGPAPQRVSAIDGLAEQLRMQDTIAQALRRVRRAHGALSLETVEARPVFKDEALTDLRADERNRAKELIEDFMIAANGVVAKFLDARGRASLRRVLRSPERWVRIVALAKDNGGELPGEPDAIALNEFLASRREADPKGFADLSLSVIKLLGAGEYSVELPHQKTAGHFGLAVQDYTHSTAPNRRYPDLVTQRLLKAALRNQPPPYSADELQVLAAHCNDQERNAAKVERQVRKAASAMLLASHIGERFEGIVTGASAKGTWVRVKHPVAEGKIVKGDAGLDVGDRVTVQLLHVDADRGFIDFSRAG